MFLRKGVVWKNYDRESVLYDLENDSTLTLNETSTRIYKGEKLWEIIILLQNL